MLAEKKHVLKHPSLHAGRKRRQEITNAIGAKRLKKREKKAKDEGKVLDKAGYHEWLPKAASTARVLAADKERQRKGCKATKKMQRNEVGYECEYDCGFSGTFGAVAEHEKGCANK